jgi:glycosyltransferase involved in cell wall biosynthesis
MNSECYIADTVRCILSQSYPNIEHIVIDACSTDKTLEIIKEMSPETLIISEPDDGISDAFNKGVRLAKGEIIAILNSDDYYTDEDVIERVVKEYEQDAELKILYGNVRYIDADSGETVMTRGRSFSSGSLKDVIESICFPAFFVRKGVYEEIGYYSLKLRCAMDLDFFLRASKKYELRHLDEELAIMRWGGFSTENIFRGHRETYRIFRSNGMPAFSAALDVFTRYVTTCMSLAMQRLGLTRAVLLYRRRYRGGTKSMRSGW